MVKSINVNQANGNILPTVFINGLCYLLQEYIATTRSKIFSFRLAQHRIMCRLDGNFQLLLPLLPALQQRCLCGFLARVLLISFSLGNFKTYYFRNYLWEMQHSFKVVGELYLRWRLSDFRRYFASRIRVCRVHLFRLHASICSTVNKNTYDIQVIEFLLWWSPFGLS